MSPIKEMVAKFREKFESSEKTQELVASIKKSEEKKAAKAAILKERLEAFRAKIAEAAMKEAESEAIDETK